MARNLTIQRGLCGLALLGILVASCAKSEDPVTLSTTLSVASTSPADAATAVDPASEIKVTFNTAALSSSITASSSGTACSGSVQLSSDDFSSCVAFSATISASSDGKTYTLTPLSPLSAATVYKIKVTTSATSSDGFALAQTYTQTTGFTVASAATTTSTALALVVSSVTPADGDMVNTRSPTITVTFNQPINPSSLTSVSSYGLCTGTLLVSGDDFAYCAPLSVSTSDNQTFTISLTSQPENGFKIRLKLTTGVTTAAGAAMASVWSHNTGFTIANWTSIDGNGSYGLNFDQNLGGTRSSAVYSNGNLYAAWAEGATDNLRLKKMDASTNQWTFLDGGTANGWGPTVPGSKPDMVAFNSKIYITWVTGTPSLVKVREYDPSTGTTSEIGGPI